MENHEKPDFIESGLAPPTRQVCSLGSVHCAPVYATSATIGGGSEGPRKKITFGGFDAQQAHCTIAAGSRTEPEEGHIMMRMGFVAAAALLLGCAHKAESKKEAAEVAPASSSASTAA